MSFFSVFGCGDLDQSAPFDAFDAYPTSNLPPHPRAFNRPPLPQPNPPSSPLKECERRGLRPECLAAATKYAPPAEPYAHSRRNSMRITRSNISNMPPISREDSPAHRDSTGMSQTSGGTRHPATVLYPDPVQFVQADSQARRNAPPEYYTPETEQQDWVVYPSQFPSAVNWKSTNQSVGVLEQASPPGRIDEHHNVTHSIKASSLTKQVAGCQTDGFMPKLSPGLMFAASGAKPADCVCGKYAKDPKSGPNQPLCLAVTKEDSGTDVRSDECQMSETFPESSPHSANISENQRSTGVTSPSKFKSISSSPPRPQKNAPSGVSAPFFKTKPTFRWNANPVPLVQVYNGGSANSGCNSGSDGSGTAATSRTASKGGDSWSMEVKDEAMEGMSAPGVRSPPPDGQIYPGGLQSQIMQPTQKLATQKLPTQKLPTLVTTKMPIPAESKVQGVINALNSGVGLGSTVTTNLDEKINVASRIILKEENEMASKIEKHEVSRRTEPPRVESSEENAPPAAKNQSFNASLPNIPDQTNNQVSDSSIQAQAPQMMIPHVLFYSSPRRGELPTGISEADIQKIVQRTVHELMSKGSQEPPTNQNHEVNPEKSKDLLRGGVDVVPSLPINNASSERATSGLGTPQPSTPRLSTPSKKRELPASQTPGVALVGGANGDNCGTPPECPSTVGARKRTFETKNQSGGGQKDTEKKNKAPSGWKKVGNSYIKVADPSILQPTDSLTTPSVLPNDSTDLANSMDGNTGSVMKDFSQISSKMIDRFQIESGRTSTRSDLSLPWVLPRRPSGDCSSHCSSQYISRAASVRIEGNARIVRDELDSTLQADMAQKFRDSNINFIRMKKSHYAVVSTEATFENGDQFTRRVEAQRDFENSIRPRFHLGTSRFSLPPDQLPSEVLCFVRAALHFGAVEVTILPRGETLQHFGGGALRKWLFWGNPTFFDGEMKTQRRCVSVMPSGGKIVWRQGEYVRLGTFLRHMEDIHHRRSNKRA